MAEQQLHDAQVGAMVQQVRRERVPQRMRRERRVHIGRCRVTLDDVPELLTGHALRAARDEQRIRRARAQFLRGEIPEDDYEEFLRREVAGNPVDLGAESVLTTRTEALDLIEELR